MKNFYYLIEKGKTPTTENDFEFLIWIKEDTDIGCYINKFSKKEYIKYPSTGSGTWSPYDEKVLVYSSNRQNGIIATFNKVCDGEKFTLWRNGKKKIK